MSGSIGSIIFLGGKKRITHYNASFFIHESKGGSAKDLDMYNNLMAETYSNATGKSKEFFLEEMKKETTYNGQQTYDLGFATELKEDLKAVALMDFYESTPQTAKEPTIMAMSKEEKAKVEALEAEILALKTEQEAQAKLAADKEAEIEKIKAEQDQKVSEAIKAEKERESGILAAVSVPKQLEFAKKLVAEGKDLMSAKVALLDDLNANKELYLKAEATPSIEALVSEAPLASKAEGEVLEASKDELYKEYRALKNQGEYAKAEQFFNDKLK